jgi:ectoine hydroxylase-related dioxygenase (phytanoyl-CoA dioxygenase family)
MDVRRGVLAVCERLGWVRPSSGPIADVAPAKSMCVRSDPEFRALYDEIVSLEEFNRLAHAPELLSVLRSILEEEVVVHGGKVPRIVFPNGLDHLTRPHQDFFYGQGAITTLTAWIPLGACPREHGPLGILEASHSDGLRHHSFAGGPGGMAIPDGLLGGNWLTASFDPGDVLIFRSLTVHRSLPNTSTQLRLSLDCRYQGVSQPITPHAFEPSGGRLEWKDVYRSWTTSDLCYYWRALPLRFAPHDPAPMARRDDEAIAEAANGNAEARSWVELLLRLGGDPDRMARARAALCAPEPEPTLLTD